MKLQKKRRGGANPRARYKHIRTSNNPQQVFLMELVKINGGLTRLTKEIQKHLGDNNFPRHHINNWRARGVPLEYIFSMSDFLEVSPFLLNYKDMINLSKGLNISVKWKGLIRDLNFVDEPPTWIKLIRRCDFLPINVKSKLLNLGELEV